MSLLLLSVASIWATAIDASEETCGDPPAGQQQSMGASALIQRSTSQTQSIARSEVVQKTRKTNIDERYLRLVEMAVTGSLTDEAGSCVASSLSCSETKAYVAKERESGMDWPPYGHTMVGHKRLQNVRMAIEETVANKIPGDFAELGVWRGGTCIYAKALYDVAGEDARNVHVFDVFAEVESFTQVNYAYHQSSKFLAVSEEAVKHNFEKYGVLDDTVKFHKGLFKDTLPVFANTDALRKISVLRIDGNFYDSYQDALFYLYPMVPVGGIVIFDDVLVDQAAMQAWLDFKKDNGLEEELARIDYASAWFRKTADIKTDLIRRPFKDCNLERSNRRT